MEYARAVVLRLPLATAKLLRVLDVVPGKDKAESAIYSRETAVGSVQAILRTIFPSNAKFKESNSFCASFPPFRYEPKIAASRLVFCTFCEKYAAPDVFDLLL